jgi:hypothetical protein
MKRTFSVLAATALMAVMFVAMASAALAVPPASGRTGCDGGLTNANHAVYQTSVSDQMRAGDAPGTQDNGGLDTARETGPIGYSSNCRP